MTGFCMKCNTGLKCVNQQAAKRAKLGFFGCERWEGFKDRGGGGRVT